jgi:hypothetical protein
VPFLFLNERPLQSSFFGTIFLVGGGGVIWNPPSLGELGYAPCDTDEAKLDDDAIFGSLGSGVKLCGARGE